MLNFFSKKGGRSVGIDIGSSSIKVVEVQKKGSHAELVTYGLLEVGPYDQKEIGRAVTLSEDKVVEALTDVLRESKVTATDAGIAIPFRSSFMRMVEFPQVTESELETMVPIEARKYIPVPMAEVSLDWSLVPQVARMTGGENEEEKKVNVLLVAIHNEVLSRFEKIAKGSKLSKPFYEVESYSTMRSVIPQSNEAVMICDIGAGSTKVYVTYKGFVVYSHIVNIGSQDITLNLSKSTRIKIDEAEMQKREVGLSGGSDDQVYKTADLVLSRISAELTSVKNLFEQKYSSKITKVSLVGGGAQLKGLSTYIQDKLKLETEKADPFGQVQVPEFLTGTLKEIGPEFAVAVGCALRGVSENE